MKSSRFVLLEGWIHNNVLCLLLRSACGPSQGRLTLSLLSNSAKLNSAQRYTPWPDTMAHLVPMVIQHPYLSLSLSLSVSQSVCLSVSPSHAHLLLLTLHFFCFFFFSPIPSHLPYHPFFPSHFLRTLSLLLCFCFAFFPSLSSTVILLICSGACPSLSLSYFATTLSSISFSVVLSLAPVLFCRPLHGLFMS